MKRYLESFLLYTSIYLLLPILINVGVRVITDKLGYQNTLAILTITVTLLIMVFTLLGLLTYRVIQEQREIQRKKQEDYKIKYEEAVTEDTVNPTYKTYKDFVK